MRALLALLLSLFIISGIFGKNIVTYGKWPSKPGIAILLSTEFICGNKKLDLESW